MKHDCMKLFKNASLNNAVFFYTHKKLLFSFKWNTDPLSNIKIVKLYRPDVTLRTSCDEHKLDGVK